MDDSLLSHQGDTVDLICYRYYGARPRAVEAVYKANPGLADQGPVLPVGTRVFMPVITEKRQKTTIKLWE